MSTRARIIMAVAALALGLMYVVPMWTISLDAPQYPEGIGLEIWINTIQGQKEHDLNNINNLNHYIGMKHIVPDAIPELKIMPWLMAMMIGLGLTVAATGKRWLLYIWVGAFVALAVVGLVDFYLWAYDYGHNLDTEHAIIKVPGMTYQPPIIGTKQLLNFTAASWPALGGWVAFASLFTGMVLALEPWLAAKRSRTTLEVA